ncbi:DinB family protein [Mucilaginibacter terrae]|uniref:DinB family protein n=1 Tax=Mucilaginibacter terrae TaxID=1955052 RepID=UPI00362C0F96
MKDHFLQLFRYDRFANLQFSDLIIEAGQLPAAVRLMAHLLGAQQTWLSRCKETPLPNSCIWPDWQAEQFKYIIEDNYQAIAAYLADKNERDFTDEIVYHNSKGDLFKNTVTDMLTQVTNHGTHHRAQIGLLLKEAGLTQLPVTDYIWYIRQQNH